MTAQREEWRRLVDAATPGPWRASEATVWRPAGDVADPLDFTGVAVAWTRYRSEPDPPVVEPDAAFIAAAREAVPSLLAQLDEAEVREAGLRAWIDKRKARDKRSRDRYRVAHPDVHRKSARESMAKTRAARAALAKGKP